MRRLGRRGALGLAGLSLCAAGPPAAGGLVSLDWGVSETLFAMGLPVAGAAALRGYRRVLADPPPPAGTQDLGLWNAPNLEAVLELRPRLIGLQSWQAPLAPLMRRIAPTEMVTLYTRRDSPYLLAGAATRALAARAGVAAAGETLVADADALLESCRARLASWPRRPVLVVKGLDDGRPMVFSRMSLMDDVLRRLGLENAWPGPPRLLCGGEIVDVAALAAYGEAMLLLVDAPAGTPAPALYGSALWNSLAFVRGGRQRRLPSLWEFAALPTAMRFAAHATAALAGPPA